METPSAPLPGRTASCPSAARETQALDLWNIYLLGSLAMAEPAACPSSPWGRAEGLSCLGKGNVMFPTLHVTFVLPCCATQTPKPLGKAWGSLGSSGMGAFPALLPAESPPPRSVNTEKQAHGWATDGISSPTLNFRGFVALTYLNTLFCGLI